MKKKILVIGGTSYVGLNFIKKYFQTYDLTYTYSSKKMGNQWGKALEVNLTTENPFFLLEKNPSFDYVIFCSQANKYSQEIENYKNIIDVNISGLQKSLDFCRVNKAKNLIYLSSGSVYDASLKKPSKEISTKISLKSHYAFSKYMGEKICEHYTKKLNIKVIVLRLFTIYGENQTGKVVAKMKNNILNNQPIILNDGIGMHFTPIYIKDLVKILSKFIEQKNSTIFDVINVAGNKMYTLNEVCEMIADITGKEAKFKFSSTSAAYAVGSIDKFKKVIPNFKFTPLKLALQSICKTEVVQ